MLIDLLLSPPHRIQRNPRLSQQSLYQRIHTDRSRYPSDGPALRRVRRDTRLAPTLEGNFAILLGKPDRIRFYNLQLARHMQRDQRPSWLLHLKDTLSM